MRCTCVRDLGIAPVLSRRLRAVLPDVIEICEDKGFIDVEPERDNVFSVLPSESSTFLQLKILPKKLFIVS